MKIVAIIGAGATRAEAMSQRAKREQRPPLDTDFFELAEIHEVGQHNDTVREFMKGNFKIDTGLAPRPRMEQVFGLVFSSSLVNPVPARVRRTINSLFRIYVKVIARTTNWVHPRSRGPICRLLRKMVKAGDTTIITFNQDIIIEKALDVLSQKDPAISWFPDTGYAMDFSGFTGPSGKSKSIELFERTSSKEPCRPVVLKPHGSLNWYVKTSRKDRVPTQLKSTQKVLCTQRKRIVTDMTVTEPTKSGKGRQTWYTWPVIVPPIIEKGTFLAGALNPIWSEAWNAIETADLIVVYGYSFPDGDQQSQSFFLRANSHRSKPPKLVTINPDFTAANRAQSLFRPSVHVVANSVRDLLSDPRFLFE